MFLAFFRTNIIQTLGLKKKVREINFKKANLNNIFILYCKYCKFKKHYIFKEHYSISFLILYFFPYILFRVLNTETQRKG